MASDCEGELKKSLVASEDNMSCRNEKNDHSNKKKKEEEEEEEESWSLRAMELASSSVLPMVMQAVVDLGVLGIISSKAGSDSDSDGVSADEIASQLELSADATTTTTASSMLDRMLCLLAAHSVLTCTYYTPTNPISDETTATTTVGRRLYRLSPIADYFIPNSHGMSLGPFMSLLQDKVFMDSWVELKPAVLKGGIPFNRVHGMHAFEYPEKDHRFNEVFNKAMINHTTILITKILNSSYNGFGQLHQLVDVGGGLGVTLNLITSKHPHIKGVNFDLPHVIQHAPHYPGVEHVAGDMFESVPSGDAIFMKWILHDWSDDHCLKLLKNCYKALPEKGKVIVVEGILPLVPNNSPAAKGICQHDLIMMTQNPGGKERTEHEFLSLATSAGFAGIRFECCVCNFWVMEFYK